MASCTVDTTEHVHHVKFNTGVFFCWFALLTKGHFNHSSHRVGAPLTSPFITTVFQNWARRETFSHDPRIMLILGCTTKPFTAGTTVTAVGQKEWAPCPQRTVKSHYKVHEGNGVYNKLPGSHYT